MAEHTISTVTAELVGRGIPRWDIPDTDEPVPVPKTAWWLSGSLEGDRGTLHTCGSCGDSEWQLEVGYCLLSLALHLAEQHRASVRLGVKVSPQQAQLFGGWGIFNAALRRRAAAARRSSSSACCSNAPSCSKSNADSYPISGYSDHRQIEPLESGAR